MDASVIPWPFRKSDPVSTRNLKVDTRIDPALSNNHRNESGGEAFLDYPTSPPIQSICVFQKQAKLYAKYTTTITCQDEISSVRTFAHETIR